MLIKPSAALAVAAILFSGSAWAETVEVKMLNKGEAGAMLFEPGFVQIAPGDTVKFIATDKGHNAASIEGMIPEGAEPFDGKINEELEVTLDTEGLYAVKCTPHYAMGMVMTIAVGDGVEQPEDYLEGRLPPNAKKRLSAELENL